MVMHIRTARAGSGMYTSGVWTGCVQSKFPLIFLDYIYMCSHQAAHAGRLVLHMTLQRDLHDIC